MHVSGCGIPSVRQSASCDIKGWVLGFWGFRSRFESVGLLRFSGGLGLRVSGCSLNNREIVFPQINIIVPPPPMIQSSPLAHFFRQSQESLHFVALLSTSRGRASFFACCVVVIAEYLCGRTSTYPLVLLVVS